MWIANLYLNVSVGCVLICNTNASRLGEEQQHTEPPPKDPVSSVASFGASDGTTCA
jgi:hypothetical protein